MNTITDNVISQLNDRLPRFDPALFKPPQFAINAEQGVASQFHKRLVTWINEFNNSLDNDHEVGVRLVSFGQSVVFHLSNISYSDPFLISFSGSTDDGQPVELIQHINQISILLMKVPRKNPSEPKKTIGFVMAKDLEE